MVNNTDAPDIQFLRRHWRRWRKRAAERKKALSPPTVRNSWARSKVGNHDEKPVLVFQ